MRNSFTILVVTLFVLGCNTPSSKEEVISLPEGSTAPEWTKNASIYEVNIRQYTPEGTINAFSEHLDSIKALGTDILWLMPIFPIGEEMRKGGMGSAYSVEDYRAVNPDYGTIEDLNRLVAKAHRMDMYVILDWVANHSAWDNPLTKTNPEWYYKDGDGNFKPPVDDWSDVIHLNYENPELRNYMIESLKFWVTISDVDGFRCDVAGMVPTDFWEDARRALDDVKPVFMLAEAEQIDHLDYAFDMNYGWELHHIMNSIAKSEMNVGNLRGYLTKYDSQYAPTAYRMNFTTNHDENSWNGTINERMGDAQKAMGCLMATLPGMPLIYSGQEAGLDKQLRFFEKDTIIWGESDLRQFYKTLLLEKKRNMALWNGEAGGSLNIIDTGQADEIFAFSREKGGDKIIAVFNLSPEATPLKFSQSLDLTGMKDLFQSGGEERLSGSAVTLKPWDYIILTSK